MGSSDTAPGAGATRKWLTEKLAAELDAAVAAEIAEQIQGGIDAEVAERLNVLLPPAVAAEVLERVGDGNFATINGGKGNLVVGDYPLGTTATDWDYAGELRFRKKPDGTFEPLLRRTVKAETPNTPDPVDPDQGSALDLAHMGIKAEYQVTGSQPDTPAAGGLVSGGNVTLQSMALFMQQAVLQGDKDGYDVAMGFLLAKMRRGSRSTFKNLFAAQWDTTTGAVSDWTAVSGTNAQLWLAVYRAWNVWSRTSDKALASELVDKTHGLRAMLVIDEDRTYLGADDGQFGATVDGKQVHHVHNSKAYIKVEIGRIPPTFFRLAYIWTGDTAFQAGTRGLRRLLERLGDVSSRGLVPRYCAVNITDHGTLSVIGNGVNGWSEDADSSYDDIAADTVRGQYLEWKLFSDGNAKSWLQGAIKNFYATEMANAGKIYTRYALNGSSTNTTETASGYWQALFALITDDPNNAVGANIRTNKIYDSVVSKTVGSITVKYIPNQIKGATYSSSRGGNQAAWTNRAIDSGSYAPISLYGTQGNVGTTSPTSGPGYDGSGTTPPTTEQPPVVDIPTSPPANSSSEKVFADPQSVVAQWANALPAGNNNIERLRKQAAMWFISQPSAVWVGYNWDPQGLNGLKPMFDRSPIDAIVLWVLYSIFNRDPGQHSDNSGINNDKEYNAHVISLCNVVGSRKSVMIWEPDALSQLTLLNSEQQANRLATFNYNLGVMRQRCPNLEIYIDCGHPRWNSPQTMAERLRKVGNPERAHGFSLNVSNFCTLEECHAYGKELLRLMNIPHWQYVVDTSASGNPDPIDDAPEPDDGKDGQFGGKEPWINPARRRLGPTTQIGNTGIPGCRGWGWFKRKGESDGARRGAPSAGSLFAEPYLWNNTLAGQWGVDSKNIYTSSGMLQRQGSPVFPTNGAVPGQ